MAPLGHCCWLVDGACLLFMATVMWLIDMVQLQEHHLICSLHHYCFYSFMYIVVILLLLLFQVWRFLISFNFSLGFNFSVSRVAHNIYRDLGRIYMNNFSTVDYKFWNGFSKNQSILYQTVYMNCHLDSFHTLMLQIIYIDSINAVSGLRLRVRIAIFRNIMPFGLYFLYIYKNDICKDKKWLFARVY